MVTETRKRIFMIVMSSEDCVDAASKLLQMKLNKNKLKEIAVVIVECAGNEKVFNKYYVYLAEKLIQIN